MTREPDFLEDTVESAERYAKGNPRVQRGLVGLRERLGGFSSSLSWNEINLCAAAIARYSADDGSLSDSDRPAAKQLLSYFSDGEWTRVIREAQSYKQRVRVTWAADADEQPAPSAD
jgi:hypothetical protein